jgi:multidrug resistance efflux pump
MEDPRILGPIPTPPSQRWREVRLLYLPRIVFAIGVGVAALLWHRTVAPSSMVGQAEVEAVEIRAAQAGILAELKVGPLQTVKAGDVVAQVSGANPRLLDATLAVIRADVDMLMVTNSGLTDRQKIALDFERMQLDWMRRRAELAVVKGKLQQAETDLRSGEPLHKAGLITDDNFLQLKNNRDALTEQSGELTQIVSHMEPILRDFAKPESQASGLSSETATAAAIKVQDAKLKLAEAQLMPVALVAPVNGVVSTVLRHAGEIVATGDTVMRITPTKSQRLTAFIRQPLSFEPKVGMTVEVTTRSGARQRATTRIVEIGAEMESIPTTMLAALHLPANTPPELGLRIQLAMPQGLDLRPGEHVDLRLR